MLSLNICVNNFVAVQSFGGFGANYKVYRINIFSQCFFCGLLTLTNLIPSTFGYSSPRGMRPL